MKDHFISLFEPSQVRRTIALFSVAAILILGSLLIGISDNLPMIALFFTGLVVLLFSILHTWKKASNFWILAAVSLAILILDFIWPFISEGVAMSIGFICLAGIITGIIGIFTRIKSWNRLPYSASLLALLTLGIFLSLHMSLRGKLPQGIEWLMIVVQLLISLLLFVIGKANMKENPTAKLLLIIIGTVLLLLCIWGFHSSTWQFEENAKGFTALMLRIYAVAELITASLALYACL
jgi:hypothetical protein